jgi:hypothetical protein
MIPFLALPPGASVKHTSLQIEAVLGDLTVASSSNDLLSRLSRTTIFV